MKTDSKYAALVAGLRVANVHTRDGVVPTVIYQGREWQPLKDDGDSRRLEAACMKWLRNTFDSGVDIPDPFRFLLACMGDARCGDDRAKDRVTVHDLAVAIGKTMEDNTNEK